ncbi:MAG: 1-acyl-sn-glycerol-3-phosphate acyltransferase [Bacteroidales bacterium]
MIRFFINIYNYFEHHSTSLKMLLFMLVVLCGFSASRILLKEDISGFLPSSPETHDIRFVTSNLKGQDKIIINIIAKGEEALDKDYAIEAAENLVKALESMAAKYIDSIFYYVEDSQILSVAEFIASNAPYFMEEQDYVRLDSFLVNDKIEKIIARQKELLVSPVGGVMESVLLKDPLSMTSRTLGNLLALNKNSQYTTYNSYLYSKDFSRQILIITPRWRTTETALNSGLQEVIETAITTTKEEFNEIDIRYFGAPIIAVTNALRIKKDTVLSIVLSLALILGLMLYVFRSFKQMLLVALPVLFGALFAIGIIWLIQGNISAIAIGAGSIIFGIAISYSIHFVLHLGHCESMRNLISEIAQPMTVGSLSTVGAFLSLLFIKAEAMRDFGLFAALSLIGAILFVLIFLPHIVKVKSEVTELRFKRISSYKFENNRWVILVISVFTIFFLYFAPRTSFDTDLQKINYMSEQQRKDMHFIVEPNSEQRTLCLASVSEDIDNALHVYYNLLPVVDSLLKTGVILNANNFGTFVHTTNEQTQKIERWNQFWYKWNKEELKEKIAKIASKNNFTQGALNDFFTMLDKTYTLQNIDFYKTLPFVGECVIGNDEKKGVVMFLTVSIDNIEKVLQAFDSIDGVIIFDQNSINRSMVEALVDDFNFVLYICGFIVFILLWLSFGRIEIALVAFIPMIISWVWILGIMAIFGLNFNVINIILATFIFGLGDDFSIFITDGKIHEYAYGSKMTDSHKNAVILSALTMLFGIGTLVFAKHPAMVSLAYVTLIGMVSVVIMAYILPPFLFNALVYKKGQVRLTPVTFEKIVKSIYSFIVFFMGSLHLTIVGFALFTIGKHSLKNKLRYHIILCNVCRFVVRNLPMVESKIINLHQETFEKPAVIIANHESHLDLMYILALSPKIILLTNQWVWKSPFYGLIIRYADFYPVVNGVESSVDKLSALVKQGYSIVVFPEGTRSIDQKIHRFHKGAFYFAKELGLDILSIVMHGIGGALPKQESLMRHSTVTISIMERLLWQNKPLNEQPKQARKLMIAEAQKLKGEIENCNTLYHKVIGNYIYKGANIEREARGLLKEKYNYRDLIAQLPTEGTVLIKNCGIGVGTLMVALLRPNLTIYATDADNTKLLLASKCSSVPPNLHYVTNAEEIKVDTTVEL